MKLNTKHFGEIDIDEKIMLNFDNGLYGFEDNKRFIIIDNPDKEVPFKWLQSIDNPDLTFVIVNPFIFKPDYDFNLSQSVIDKLNIEDEKEIVVYTIVVIPEDINKMTANLAAPLIINANKLLGKQIIIDDVRYSHKHLIVQETQNSQQEE